MNYFTSRSKEGQTDIAYDDLYELHQRASSNALDTST